MLGNQYLEAIPSQKYKTSDMIAISRLTGFRSSANDDMIVNLIQERKSIESLKFLIQDPVSEFSLTYQNELAMSSIIGSLAMLISALY